MLANWPRNLSSCTAHAKTLISLGSCQQANSPSLNHAESSLGYDGSKLVVGHVDGTLELRGVLRAEGRWLAIGALSRMACEALTRAA
jgi:hypothetical protein